MKKIALSTVLLLLAAFTFAQGSKVTGFRNLVWGVHRDSVYSNGEHIIFLKDKDASEANVYTVKDDNLSLGAANLTKIQYHFNKENRFKRVVMNGDAKYYEDMKFIAQHKFGTAKKDETQNLSTMSWQDGNVSIKLTSDSKSSTFLMSIESTWDMTESFVKNRNVNDIPYDGKIVAGFRSLKWLDKKDDIRIGGEKVNFVLDKEASEPNTYYLENEKLVIGAARLMGISYVFSENDKLTKVIITGSQDYFDDIKYILSNKLGPAKGMATFSDDLSVADWKIADTTIKLSVSNSGNVFTCIMESSKEYTERYKENMNVTDF